MELVRSHPRNIVQCACGRGEFPQGWLGSPISSQLDGADCLWSSFCVAAGHYTTSGGSIKSLAIFRNGTEWSACGP